MKRQKGFTLIEIVLVLAIAGLLLVIVFLAVGNAQRARRDHQRKQDLARALASIETYAGNHGGRVPTDQASADDVEQNYFQNDADPLTGLPYQIQYRFISAPHSGIPPVGTIYYEQGHWCNRGPQSNPSNPSDPIAGDDVTLTKFVVWTGLEVGNGTVWYCLDNL